MAWEKVRYGLMERASGDTGPHTKLVVNVISAVTLVFILRINAIATVETRLKDGEY